MLPEGMNSTRNFVFVVLVATQGIIGDTTSLNPVEGQTDDVLGLTTLTNRNGDDQDRTGSTKHSTNTTDEQTTRSHDKSSSVQYAYEAPTEINPKSTKIARNSAITKKILEDLETSDGEITTDVSHHTPTSHTVEHSIRKDMSNNNEIEVSEKNASDKKTTNMTPGNSTVDDHYVIFDTTTEQPRSEPIETTAMNYDDDDIDDYNERTTDQDTEKGTTDFLKEHDDVDISKFYRRMFEISHSLEDSNNKPETVARTSTTITSLQDHSHLKTNKTQNIEKSHDPYKDNSRVSHNENNRQSNEDHSHQSHQTKSQQSYDPSPVTPPYTDTNTHLDPYLNSRSGTFLTAQSGQSGSFENERRVPQAWPQFNNHQRLTYNQPQLPPPQFMQPSFEQLQPQLQPSSTLYHPLPQHQQHLSMQMQYPWPTVQPVPNHMDNILASLQQASLHPVLSAKQYKDFYEKQYIYPSNLF